jgi:hypothetical protein
MISLRNICLIFYVLLCSSALAGPFQYECTIEQVMRDSGGDSSDLLKELQSNKVFIERNSGVILHPWWGLSKGSIQESRVIHKGNQNSSYKAISVTIHGFLVAVTVREFARGNKKPMALLESGKVMTGFCY